MMAGTAQKWFGWLPICGGKVEMEEIVTFGFQSLENLWSFCIFYYVMN